MLLQRVRSGKINCYQREGSFKFATGFRDLEKPVLFVNSGFLQGVIFSSSSFPLLLFTAGFTPRRRFQKES